MECLFAWTCLRWCISFWCFCVRCASALQRHLLLKQEHAFKTLRTLIHVFTSHLSNVCVIHFKELFVSVCVCARRFSHSLMLQSGMHPTGIPHPAIVPPSGKQEHDHFDRNIYLWVFPINHKKINKKLDFFNILVKYNSETLSCQVNGLTLQLRDVTLHLMTL